MLARADDGRNSIVRNFGADVAATLVLPVALLAVIAGCASGPPKPAQVTGTIQASAQVNPSTTHRPSPLQVRVYELKSAAAFSAADFMSLYQRDQAELGGDMLAKDEFILAPGESKPYVKTLAPDTRFIGVLAAFRDIEHARWRSIVPIKPGQKQRVEIRATDLAVEASAK